MVEWWPSHAAGTWQDPAWMLLMYLLMCRIQRSRPVCGCFLTIKVCHCSGAGWLMFLLQPSTSKHRYNGLCVRVCVCVSFDITQVFSSLPHLQQELNIDVCCWGFPVSYPHGQYCWLPVFPCLELFAVSHRRRGSWRSGLCWLVIVGAGFIGWTPLLSVSQPCQNTGSTTMSASPWLLCTLIHLLILVLYKLFVCLLNLLLYLLLFLTSLYTFFLTSLLVYFLTYLLLPE